MEIAGLPPGWNWRMGVNGAVAVGTSRSARSLKGEDWLPQARLHLCPPVAGGTELAKHQSATSFVKYVNRGFFCNKVTNAEGLMSGDCTSLQQLL